MVACGLRFILQSCHLLTTYDASHSSDFKLLCIKVTQLSSRKTTTAYDRYLPWFRRLTGLSWAVLIVALQRVADWWWLGGQAADRVESTCKLLHSHAGVWARRIQLWAECMDLSLSLHLSNTAAWGGQTSQTWLRSSKLCGLREHAEPGTSTTSWPSVGSYERVSHPQGGGLVPTSRQEEWQRV